MRTAAYLLLSALIVWTTVGCNKKTDSTNSISTAGIEGTYIITGMELFGEKAEEGDLVMFAGKDESDRVVTITADTLTFNKGGKSESSKYKLDPTKTPGEIDLTDAEKKMSKTIYGIYKMEGDTLVIAITGPLNQKDEKGNMKMPQEPEAKDRLKDFKTRPNSFDILWTMKKKK